MSNANECINFNQFSSFFNFFLFFLNLQFKLSSDSAELSFFPLMLAVRVYKFFFEKTNPTLINGQKLFDAEIASMLA